MMFLVALLLIPALSCANANTISDACALYPFALLENGNISAVGVNKLRFQCHPGYYLAHPEYARCTNGTWSSTRQPLCFKTEGRCEDPPPVENGVVNGKGRRPGSAVFYICNPGFVLLGNEIRRCLQSLHWDGTMPSCMDETEPLLKVAERLKDKFVTDLVEKSENMSFVGEGKLLDPDSLHHGLELVVLMDRSSSVDEYDFRAGLRFVKFLMEEFNVHNGGRELTGTRAAVYTFGTNVDILFNLDNVTITDPEAASKALDTLQAGGGGTAMETALTNVFTYLSETRDQAKKAIFLMTDGEPNVGTPGISPEDVARQLREYGKFEIFTMGIGRGINRRLLSNIASAPPLNHVFILDNYQDLSDIIKLIRNAPPKPKPVSPDRCGYIKGEEFYLKKWPWLAAIFTSDVNGSLGFCAGALICRQWVLTAASCIKPDSTQEAQLLFVVLGEHTIIQEDPFDTNFYAVQVVLHPDFNPLKKLHSNLALLKLNEPVSNDKYRPVCLPPTDRLALHLKLDLNVSIAGWGFESPNLNVINGETLNIQRSTGIVEMATTTECKSITGRAYSDEIFCAGFGKTTCIGDVGSPVVALDTTTNLHHVIGILSGKRECALKTGYNQYTELRRHLAWINGVTADCQREHWMA